MMSKSIVINDEQNILRSEEEVHISIENDDISG